MDHAERGLGVAIVTRDLGTYDEVQDTAFFDCMASRERRGIGANREGCADTKRQDAFSQFLHY